MSSLKTIQEAQQLLVEASDIITLLKEIKPEQLVKNAEERRNIARESIAKVKEHLQKIQAIIDGIFNYLQLAVGKLAEDRVEASGFVEKAINALISEGGQLSFTLDMAEAGLNVDFLDEEKIVANALASLRTKFEDTATKLQEIV